MRNGKYSENKARAITINTDPTESDQAGAKETDINVIVAKFAIHGQMPGASAQPMSGDFSEVPTSLREMIEKAREVTELRKALPKELKELSLPELMALTPEQLKNKLTPPAPKPETKVET